MRKFHCYRIFEYGTVRHGMAWRGILVSTRSLRSYVAYFCRIVLRSDVSRLRLSPTARTRTRTRKA